MTKELDDATRCTFDDHGRRCDARGTHRLVVVLSSRGNPALAKKYLWADGDGQAVRRCKAHQEKDPTVFISEATWNRLKENFARSGFKATDSMHVPIADRSRTMVFYVDDVTKIEEIPVMVPTPGGLEEVGKTRILS